MQWSIRFTRRIEKNISGLPDGAREEGQADFMRWEESSVSPREDSPGVFLAGARYREELSQRALAEKTGIPQRHISEMENGKRPVGKANAKKLAEALNVDYRVFL